MAFGGLESPAVHRSRADQDARTSARRATGSQGERNRQELHAPARGTASLRLTATVSRIRQAAASLRVAAQNADVRRAELAWGASISAEWAHFVALGVFAYDHGGSTAVGIAGLMRLLPAAAIAPFALRTRAARGGRQRCAGFRAGFFGVPTALHASPCA
jgi:hypothetical protein